MSPFKEPAPTTRTRCLRAMSWSSQTAAIDRLLKEFRVKQQLTPAKRKGNHLDKSAKRVASGQQKSKKKEQKKNPSDSESSFDDIESSVSDTSPSAASKTPRAATANAATSTVKKSKFHSDSYFSAICSSGLRAAKPKSEFVISAAISDDDAPMVPALAPAAKKVANPKAEFADDGDADFMDDYWKKAAPRPKAAKKGGAAVAKAAPKKAPAKAKAKEKSPVAVRERPTRARKAVTYKVGKQ
jgi:hypothetical protein